MEQKGTKHTIRIAAELEPELVALVDEECKGLCGRATIVRLALMERYQVQRKLGGGRRERKAHVTK